MPTYIRTRHPQPPTANRQPPTSSMPPLLIVLDLPSRGGAETQAGYLAKGLVERGYEVHILFFIPGYTEELERFKEAGAQVHYTGFRSKLLIPPFAGLRANLRYALYQTKLVLQIRKIKPEIIIPFTYPPNIILSRCWKWTKAKKCFWNQRDEGRMFLGRDFEVKALNNTTAIISNSKEGALFLQNYTTKEIHIIHNGVLVPEISATPNASGIINVVMVANLHGYKDYLTLLKAWKMVFETIGSVKAVLKLAGKEGSTAEEIRAFIAENNISDSVQLLGQVKNINVLLKECHIGVFSSVKEGVPNGVLECMAMGLPLVSTNITGTKEALGLDYPYFSEKKDPTSLANHLLQFINDADLRQHVGQMNRGRVIREFSMAKMVKKYEDFLSS